jgi:hypothetical protein
MFPNSLPMTRAWGPGAGSELVPHGTTVWIKQWAGSGFGGVAGGFIGRLVAPKLPSSFHATLPQSGTVTLMVGKDASLRGSGMCLELENDYAKVVSFLLPKEICDFRGRNFNGFRVDSSSNVRSAHAHLNAINQATDGGRFLEEVVGHSPHQADIGVGVGAQVITRLFNKDGPMALCLDFPGVGAAILTALLDAAAAGANMPGLSHLAMQQVRKDIFLSSADTGSARRARISRGVMTHEYGHFAMCTMMYGMDPSSLTRLIDRLFEGDADSRHDVFTLFLESYADLMATFIAGGTNYLRRQDLGFTEPNENDMSYCIASPCVERNFRGANDAMPDDEFNDELGKLVTLYVDVFDGPDRFRTNHPIAGLWHMGGGGLLEVTSEEYIPLKDDEPVALKGSHLKQWLANWLATGPTLYLPALVQTMRDAGVDWCDICDVVALHEKDAPAVESASREDRQARQQYCLTQAWLGTPPEATGRFDALTCQRCAFNEVAPEGLCVSCGSDAVIGENECVTCPDMTVPDHSKSECVECGSKAIWVETSPPSCMPCGIDRGASPENTCEVCAADGVVVVDANDCLGGDTFPPTTPPAEGDVCTDELWVEVRDPSALASVGGGLAVEVWAHLTPATEEACVNTWVDLDVFEPGPDGRWDRVSSTLAQGVWECPPDLFCLECIWPDATFTRTAAELASAPEAYRFRLGGAHGVVSGSKGLSVSYTGDSSSCPIVR